MSSLWSSGNVLGVKADYSPDALLSQTNIARDHEHEAPLSLDPHLNAAAQAKANDMVKYNYWSHNSPQGKTPWSFIEASGYQYQSAGENLAYGFNDANETISGWMNSTEHRTNILNIGYQNVGFGVAQAPNFLGKGPQTVVVAEYGQPVPALATITFKVPEPAQVAGVEKSNELASKPVSRIQLLTHGDAAWSALALSAVAGAAFALFVVRHGLRLRRLMLKGESYVLHHPFIDVAVIVLCVTAVILTRTSGMIR